MNDENDGAPKQEKPVRNDKRQARPLIGWCEWAAFPELGVDRINAKIDTGAKTSAVHAIDPEIVNAWDGPEVAFYLHPVRRRKTPEFFCRLPLLDRRVVRSSNGQAEERFVVKTPIRMGDQIWPIELTLANRDAMGFRLLIGRDALANRFLIDADATYLLGKRPKK